MQNCNTIIFVSVKGENMKKSGSIVKANSAIKCSIYPTKRQELLLRRAFVERNRWYNIHCAWFRNEWKAPSLELKKWCDEHPLSDKDPELEKERKRFASSLQWPSTTKMGWPKSKVHPNEKYLSRYGEPVSIFWNAMNEAAEDDLGRAIKTTKSKGHVAFAKPWVCTFTVPLMTKRDLTLTDENNNQISVKAPYAEILESNGVKKIRIPFVSPELRKQEPNVEWFRVKFSEKALSESISQSAITVTMSKSGKFYASIRSCKPESEHIETGMECGIDVGVRDCAIVAIAPQGSMQNTDDEHFELNFDRDKVKAIERKIEHLNKLQSRRVKTWVRLNKDGKAKGLTLHGQGNHNATSVYCRKHKSNAYKRCEHRIAVLSEKIANIRKDFAEKLSRKVADEADSIGMEDLNVKGMTKNHKLARSVLRVGFYQIRTAIERKAKGRVSLADRWMPSSKTCSFCGAYNPTLKFEHEWTCPSCGRRIERDRNAATNLRPSMRYFAQANMDAEKRKMAGQVAGTVRCRAKRGGNTLELGEIRTRRKSNKTCRNSEREETLKHEKSESMQNTLCIGSESVGIFFENIGRTMAGVQRSLF
jgi:IS605 OrfB family transposase